MNERPLDVIQDLVISFSDARVSSFSMKSPSQVKSAVRDYFALKEATTTLVQKYMKA